MFMPYLFTFNHVMSYLFTFNHVYALSLYI